MKALVISHVSPSSPYGAATSIKNHIECIRRNMQIDTVFNENFPSRRADYFSLKICPNYSFFSGSALKRLIYRVRSYLISFFGLNKIDCSGYDLVHFNSLVLIRNVVDILSASNGCKPYIVFHVREVLDVNKLGLIDHQNLSKVDLFICIDSVTENRLLSVNEKYTPPGISLNIVTILSSLLTSKLYIKFLYFNFKSFLERLFKISSTIVIFTSFASRFTEK